MSLEASTTTATIDAPVARPRVLVTRPPAQAGGLERLLREAGFEPVLIAMVDVEPLDDLTALDAALRRLDSYDYLVLPSANAARIAAQRPGALGIAPASLTRPQIIAGPSTAAALAGYGLSAAAVPAPFSAEAAVAVLAARGDLRRARVLLPRAAEGREALAAGLRARGAAVDEIAVYRTIPVRESHALAEELARGTPAALTFLSPSAVRGCANALAAAGLGADALRGAAIACIGATTAGAAREHGFHVTITAQDTTAASLVLALAGRILGENR
jgi:uroporphyrinogen-III synthase